ncbi:MULTISPECIES: DUF5133 domain-containing protein [Streptomyces]|uniref:DUF5133 domain-containing protein n=1 Tax=Streptomyces cacaoi TaxID=1898 RepID=A0A4Y3QWM8_STRCI|nr:MULTISPECIES: DUF5133 domain-containing protein [Streptomyces]NNG89890.1 DUF5133 domain-containing protein [Streptomyces cacaoi]GEB49816.1 hypothetical protein SCA03_23670 [Streptomyces cacaoi]
MLAHPETLKRLVDRYETLRQQTGGRSPDTGERRELEDVSYTLCVATATRDISSALAVARARVCATRDRSEQAREAGERPGG